MGLGFGELIILLIIVLIVLVGWPSSVYLLRTLRGLPFRAIHVVGIGGAYLAAMLLTLGTWWIGMRSGVRALEEMSR